MDAAEAARQVAQAGRAAIRRQHPSSLRARRGRSLPWYGELTFRTHTRHRAPNQQPGRILIPGDGAAGDQGLRIGLPARRWRLRDACGLSRLNDFLALWSQAHLPFVNGRSAVRIRSPAPEHRNVPVLVLNPRDRRPAWHQITETLTEAIQSGSLAPGEELPSITELSALQDIGTGVIRRAFEALAADGLILTRRGQSPVVAGTAAAMLPGARKRTGPGHDCRRAGCRPHVCHPMKASTIRGIHSILSGAFAAAQRWEWTDRNPTRSAKPPTTIRRPIPATSPDDVAKVIAEARGRSAALGLYLWLVVVTGVRRGELCGLQIRDIDLDRGLMHVAFNYVVRGGQGVRKDTKTHQDRWLAIDPDTCALIAAYLYEIRTELAAVGAELRDDAYLFSNDPAHTRPWNPDWATHKVAEAAAAAEVKLDIKGGRHYTASQLLAGGFDLRNTAARLGHSGGGATTLRHYADPVPEVDRRAAAYLARLTSGSTSQD